MCVLVCCLGVGLLVRPSDEQETRPGFLVAILMVLQVREDGLILAGLPCSSYVFMNLGTSKRSLLNPFGDEEAHFDKDVL
jgi:hypothetical protein